MKAAESTAGKFHINDNGEPEKCRATKGRCPFGGTGHYATKEEAIKAIESIYKTKHKTTDQSKRLSKRSSTPPTIPPSNIASTSSPGNEHHRPVIDQKIIMVTPDGYDNVSRAIDALSDERIEQAKTKAIGSINSRLEDHARLDAEENKRWLHAVKSDLKMLAAWHGSQGEKLQAIADGPIQGQLDYSKYRAVKLTRDVEDGPYMQYIADKAPGRWRQLDTPAVIAAAEYDSESDRVRFTMRPINGGKPWRTSFPADLVQMKDTVDYDLAYHKKQEAMLTDGANASDYVNAAAYAAMSDADRSGLPLKALQDPDLQASVAAAIERREEDSKLKKRKAIIEREAMLARSLRNELEQDKAVIDAADGMEAVNPSTVASRSIAASLQKASGSRISCELVGMGVMSDGNSKYAIRTHSYPSVDYASDKNAVDSSTLIIVDSDGMPLKSNGRKAMGFTTMRNPGGRPRQQSVFERAAANVSIPPVSGVFGQSREAKTAEQLYSSMLKRDHKLEF